MQSRHIIITLTAAGTLGLTGAALAQKVWEPAPVPNGGPTTVSPAARAGGTSGTDTAGPANATPFSGPPPEVQPSSPTQTSQSDSRPGVQQGTPSTSK